MCGIVGFASRRPLPDSLDARKVLARMTNSLTHRGPDQEGQWIDPSGRLGFGHRRLSINDLSEAGRQPLATPDGRKVLVFNGEIYNYREVARELKQKGLTLRGHSDTEVLLLAFDLWGVEKALTRLAGMFAFAYYDLSDSSLWLGRDRMGEKPLYYHQKGDTFLFASELKAFSPWPGFRPDLSQEALACFFRYSYIPAPLTIYEGVSKLPPGHCLKIQLVSGASEHRPFWSLESLVKAAPESDSSWKGNEQEAVSRMGSLLEKVVGEQSSADVPVGAFLSGGIDSSLVVALMRRVDSRPVKTFTIGFQEKEFNEAQYGREVADALGCDHTELYVGPKDALRVAERLPLIYDEPFADSSQIPTFLVSELARSQVTVALSGDGGDEIFAGYNRHTVGCSAWAKARRIPYSLRSAIASSWESWPLSWRKAALSAVSSPSIQGTPQLGEKMEKLMLLLRSRSDADLYLNLTSMHTNAEGLLLRPTGFVPPLPEGGGNLLYRMQYLDALFYLPDDILTKVDRASMAVGLEVRSPFLDHRIVEMAWQLPPSMRVRKGSGKWLLRQLLAEHLPRSLIDRPKAGFALPLRDWLKGPLRAWAESLLREDKIREQGVLDAQRVRSLWDSYVAGRSQGHYLLWNVLVFQAWQEKRSSYLPQRDFSHSQAAATLS